MDVIKKMSVLCLTESMCEKSRSLFCEFTECGSFILFPACLYIVFHAFFFFLDYGYPKYM